MPHKYRVPVLLTWAFVSVALLFNQPSISKVPQRKPSFIGGDVLRTAPPGIVKLGKSDVLGNCTGTLVSPTHILTAAHCVSKDSDVLLRPYSPRFGRQLPFGEILGILTRDGAIQEREVVVKAIHLYTAAIHGDDPSKFEGMPEGDAFAHIVETGDFAILELERPALEASKFPKILFEKELTRRPLRVGGFGNKGSGWEDFKEAPYTGGAASFGEELNAFYSMENPSPNFKRETEVSATLVNVAGEITYLGAGDSGGGVFSKIGTNEYVVAVNHAGHYSLGGDGIVLDPRTGHAIKRAKGEYSEVVGFAHRFSSSNKKLVKWITNTLPKGTYEFK